MNLKIKILSVDEAEQSVVARFYTDKITEQMLATQVDASGNVLRCRTDMNITFGDIANRPKGIAIDAYLIKRFAPWQFLDMKERVADPAVNTSLADLIPLIGRERSTEVEVIEGQVVIKQTP
jgi:hypothetical protein